MGFTRGDLPLRCHPSYAASTSYRFRTSTLRIHGYLQASHNHAERELRAFVLWRRRSFGAQSERGNRFAERLMTIAHTARKQDKNVLAFLTACCVAWRDGGTAPSLFEADLATA